MSPWAKLQLSPFLHEPSKSTNFEVFALDSLEVRVAGVLVLLLGFGGKDNVMDNWLFKVRRPAYGVPEGRGRSGIWGRVDKDCLIN